MFFILRNFGFVFAFSIAHRADDAHRSRQALPGLRNFGFVSAFSGAPEGTPPIQGVRQDRQAPRVIGFVRALSTI
jgi:hypothetical protein